MPFGPIKPRKVGDAVFEQLRSRLEDGSLGPGDRLPSERELVEQMRVSRPVVREAINMLVGQGLLEIRARQGVYVRAAASPGWVDPLTNLIGDSLDRLVELLEVRRLLESQAAALAAEFATPRDVDDLEIILGALERAPRRPETGAATAARFHARIAQAAGNTVAMHVMAALHEAMVGALAVASPSGPSELYRRTVLRHYRAILDAIRAHDPEAACTRMQEHIDYVIRELRHQRRKAGDPAPQRAAS